MDQKKEYFIWIKQVFTLLFQLTLFFITYRFIPTTLTVFSYFFVLIINFILSYFTDSKKSDTMPEVSVFPF